jgi:hypothetical protein
MKQGGSVMLKGMQPNGGSDVADGPAKVPSRLRGRLRQRLRVAGALTVLVLLYVLVGVYRLARRVFGKR